MTTDYTREHAEWALIGTIETLALSDVLTLTDAERLARIRAEVTAYQAATS